MFYRICAILMLLGMSVSGAFAEDSLDRSRQIITQTNEKLKSAQKTIDQADEAIIRMLGEYKAVQKEIDNYRVYNNQLREIIASQGEEIALLAHDIDNIESTGLQIMPFMQQMIDGLERFIASDYPFLPEERRIRVARLKENMKRADLSIAAKYRQILEAYQIEIDYGNTMEAYEGDVTGKKVVFLKIGRIGLYYMSLDKQQCAAWIPAKNDWQMLDDTDYKISIAKAIKIAKKQQTPDLFFAAVSPARALSTVRSHK